MGVEEAAGSRAACGKGSPKVGGAGVWTAGGCDGGGAGRGVRRAQVPMAPCC